MKNKLWTLVGIFLFCGSIVLKAQEAVLPYFSEDEMPDMLHFLPPPPDSVGACFVHDVMQYMWGKTQRLDPVRSAIAISDADCTLDGIIRIFSEPFGMIISFEETPEIYRLLRDAIETCHNICQIPKNYYMRRRPFMLFKEQTLTPGDEASLSINGSYPSGHTVKGWSAALLLSEINPERADTLMARGYMYGESRVIVGAHWQSDVDAGRLASSVAYMKLHTSPAFLKQMEKARLEFIEKKEGQTSVAKARSNISIANKYSLSGYRISNESSGGIYVQNGEKYMVNGHDRR